MVSWGIVTICTAAVSTYAGMVVCRIFIGITEAGFFVSAGVHASAGHRRYNSEAHPAARCHDVPVLLVQARRARHPDGNLRRIHRCCRVRHLTR